VSLNSKEKDVLQIAIGLIEAKDSNKERIVMLETGWKPIVPLWKVQARILEDLKHDNPKVAAVLNLYGC